MRISRRSPTNDSEDSDGRDRFSFRNMMTTMMQQSRMEAEQREWQYKNDAEQRDWDYQLRQEELAIACEDARAEQQMTSQEQIW